MDRDTLLDLARSLVRELEDADDGVTVNPNDISNAVETLRSLSGTVSNLQSSGADRYTPISEVVEHLDNQSEELADLEVELDRLVDELESWI